MKRVVLLVLAFLALVLLVDFTELALEKFVDSQTRQYNIRKSIGDVR